MWARWQGKAKTLQTHLQNFIFRGTIFLKAQHLCSCIWKAAELICFHILLADECINYLPTGMFPSQLPSLGRSDSRSSSYLCAESCSHQRTAAILGAAPTLPAFSSSPCNETPVLQLFSPSSIKDWKFPSYYQQIYFKMPLHQFLHPLYLQFVLYLSQ